MPGLMDFGVPGVLSSPEPPKKKSILDSVLERLYPSGAFGGFLTPEALSDERHMALRHAGLSLLASSGPRPQGTRNFGADLAQAFDSSDWSQRLASVAQSGMQLSSMQRKLGDEQKADAIMARYPARPDETPQQQEARYRHLADAFMSAGLSEHAQVAASLIHEIRPPDLKEGPGGVLYEGGTGNVVGQLPQAAATVEGSQLWSNGVARLAPWDKVRSTVAQYQQFRNAPLSPTTSQGLLAAANELVNTHGGYPGSEGDMSAIEHLPVVGQLARILSSLEGKQLLTEPQRTELVRVIDQVVDRLGEESQRVRTDVERIMGSKFSPEQIKQLLPMSSPWPGRRSSRVADEIDRNTP